MGWVELDWIGLTLMRRSLFEVLSRFEIPFAICDKCFCRTKGALVAQINDLHLWENNVYLQRIHVITICMVFAYVMPLLGPELWLRVKWVAYKLLPRTYVFAASAILRPFVLSAIQPLTSARARTWTVTAWLWNLISLNPTCSCKRGTKHFRNKHNEIWFEKSIAKWRQRTVTYRYQMHVTDIASRKVVLKICQ